MDSGENSDIKNPHKKSRRHMSSSPFKHACLCGEGSEHRNYRPENVAIIRTNSLVIKPKAPIVNILIKDRNTLKL